MVPQPKIARWPRTKLAIFLWVLVWPSSSPAHAIIVESWPSVNALVAGPEVGVDIRFNSRIDKDRSRLLIKLPGAGARKLDFDPELAPDRIVSRVQGLAPGPHRLEWQVLGIDGHITRGFIPFTVLAP